jgi:Tol biopolymer transport system component
MFKQLNPSAFSTLRVVGIGVFRRVMLAAFIVECAACSQTAVVPIPTNEASTQVFASPLPTPQSPTPRLPGGHIVYHSGPDDTSFHLYMMDSSGDNVRQITRGAGNDTEAALSPNGNQIAFTSSRDGNYEIYLMEKDGSGVQRLTNNPSADWGPTWSRDGKTIAFASDRSSAMRLYVMNTDGTEQRPLLDGAMGDGWAPNWSPTRDEIAFVSNREGDSEIYALDLQTEEVRQLTFNDLQDERPSWSPDGEQIVYQGAKAQTVLFDPDEIYRIPREGGPPYQLTDNLVGDITPSWSPDGTMVVFSSSRDGGWNIYALPALGGTEPMRLTQGTSWNRSPRWGP